MSILDDYNAARQAIHDHIRFVEDWRDYPIDDMSEHYWSVDQESRILWSPVHKAVQYYLENDDWGVNGNEGYSGVVLRSRQGVFRGKEFTGVIVDTQCDGNIVLMIFRNDREVK